MNRSIRRPEWRAFLVGGLLILLAPGLAVAQNTFPASGNVGIGTLAPAVSLHIANTDVTNSVTTDLIIRHNGAASPGDGTSMAFAVQSSDAQIGKIASVNDFSGQGSLRFSTYNAGLAERLRITGTGNVGIGTTSPSSYAGYTTLTLDNAGAGGGVLDFRRAGAVIGQHASVGNNFQMAALTGDLVYTTATGSMRLTSTGNVGIGTASPAVKLHVAGDAQVDGNLAAKYQDVAEWVRTATPLPAGVVVVIDVQHQNRVLPASGPYDTRIAGVVSARPGLLLGEAGDDKVKVAHSGRVKVKVDASYGPIATGDLLVTSPTSGHAMRSTPVELGGTAIHRPGTLLGKALEPLADGQGEILVLLTIQ
jgi:hypothetical protein